MRWLLVGLVLLLAVACSDTSDLEERVAVLEEQVATLEREPGPQGPQGEEGPRGPQGAAAPREEPIVLNKYYTEGEVWSGTLTVFENCVRYGLLGSTEELCLRAWIQTDLDAEVPEFAQTETAFSMECRLDTRVGDPLPDCWR